MDAALNTSKGPVATSPRPVPFRLLGSTADVTQANQDQMVRLVAQHLEDADGTPEVSPDELEPRLTCAVNWATKLVPPEDRTTIRTIFDKETWDSLPYPDTIWNEVARHIDEQELATLTPAGSSPETPGHSTTPPERVAWAPEPALVQLPNGIPQTWVPAAGQATGPGAGAGNVARSDQVVLQVREALPARRNNQTPG